MGADGPGPTRRFLIRTMFIGPLAARPEIAVGELPQEKLPHEVAFKCWSSTREPFPPDARLVQHRVKEESNPLVVGEPVPMTEAELDELRKDPN